MFNVTESLIAKFEFTPKVLNSCNCDVVLGHQLEQHILKTAPSPLSLGETWVPGSALFPWDESLCKRNDLLMWGAMGRQPTDTCSLIWIPWIFMAGAFEAEPLRHLFKWIPHLCFWVSLLSSVSRSSQTSSSLAVVQVSPRWNSSCKYLLNAYWVVKSHVRCWLRRCNLERNKYAQDIPPNFMEFKLN